MPNRKDFTVINGGNKKKTQPTFHRGKRKIVPVPNTKNDALVAALDTYAKEHSMKSLDKIGDLLHDARVMVPVLKGSDNETPFPVCLKTVDDEMLIPVFTGKDELLKAPKTEAAMNIAFMDVGKMATIADKVAGVVVNPFSHNLVLKKAFLEVLQKNQHLSDLPGAGKGIQNVELTESQINQIERYEFEHGFLPKKFFDDPENFLATLLEEKEERIDSLFEDSYKNYRMYPYRTDEFAVFVFQPEENATVVRVEMPKRNLAPATSKQIFFVKNKEEYAYFTITRGDDNHFSVTKVDAELKVEVVVKDVADGTEVHEVMKLTGLDF